MSGRIRTIKPEAHLDEDLWDAEQESGLPLFRAFTGLWCQADKEGRFEWRPRQLKAAILPYWDGEFSRVLDAFVTRGFVVKYVTRGREYGVIPTFKKHQFINGKEAESRLPAPPDNLEDSLPSRVTYASSSRDSRVVDAPIPSPSISYPVPDPEGGAGGNQPDRRGRFTMHRGWQPSADTVESLKTELIPGWAITEIVPIARTHYGADPSDKRTDAEWNQAVAKWVRRDWRDESKRPKQQADQADRERRQREADAAHDARVAALNAKARERFPEGVPPVDPDKLLEGIG
jgi:hypothetical protein